MNTLLRWLLMAVLSALAGSAAHFFEGSCPLEPSSWVCGHWTLVVAVATLVLGAFGVRVKRPELATSKAAQKPETVTLTTVPGAPEPEPLGVEVTSANVSTRTPDEIGWQRNEDAGG